MRGATPPTPTPNSTSCSACPYCHLEETKLVFFGLHCATWSIEAKLESSNKEASPSACKNTVVVLMQLIRLNIKTIFLWNNLSWRNIKNILIHNKEWIPLTWSGHYSPTLVNLPLPPSIHFLKIFCLPWKDFLRKCHFHAVGRGRQTTCEMLYFYAIKINFHSIRNIFIMQFFILVKYLLLYEFFIQYFSGEYIWSSICICQGQNFSFSI